MVILYHAVIRGWLWWNASGFFEWLTLQPWYFEILTDWVAIVPVKSGDEVLEVGCGPGRLTAYLDEQGVQTRGMDRSPSMLSRARRAAPNGLFIQGDALDIPLEANQVDIVVAASLVNVVASPETLVKEMLRVARPGGSISVLFPTSALSTNADELAKRRGLVGLAAAALGFWGGNAPKCDPAQVMTLFKEAGIDNARLDQFFDGNLASVTGRLG